MVHKGLVMFCAYYIIFLNLFMIIILIILGVYPPVERRSKSSTNSSTNFNITLFDTDLRHCGATFLRVS